MTDTLTVLPRKSGDRTVIAHVDLGDVHLDTLEHTLTRIHAAKDALNAAGFDATRLDTYAEGCVWVVGRRNSTDAEYLADPR